MFSRKLLGPKLPNDDWELVDGHCHLNELDTDWKNHPVKVTKGVTSICKKDHIFVSLSKIILLSN